MNFGPGFVRNVYGLFGSLAVIGLVFWVLRQGIYWDADAGREQRLQSLSPVSKNLLLILFAEGTLLAWQKNVVVDVILTSIFFSCLLFATIMDIEFHMIYDYVWWVAGGVAIFSCCFAEPGPEKIIELLLFALLQEFFFAKMYGRADCHAFVVCAVFETGLGRGMREYLVHMLISFLVLAVVQLAKGNVGHGGNLKTPVAFLPYVTLGCWLSILSV